MTDQNQLLREALQKLLNRVDDFQDAGPLGEGWQSDGLLADIAAAKSLLSQPAQPAPAQPQGAGEVWGWAIVGKDGLTRSTRPKRGEFFGAPVDAEPYDAEDLRRIDMDWAGCAPHRVVTLYTTPPASQQQLQAINTLEQERQKSWQLGYSAGQKASHQAAQAVPEDLARAISDLSFAMGSPAVRGERGDLHTAVVRLAAERFRAAKGEQ